MGLSMFISFREAADLLCQMIIAVTLTAGGMTFADYVVRSERTTVSALDPDRPSLWTAGPVRIDPTAQAFVRDDGDHLLRLANVTGSTCSDAIGLRLSCDLLTTSAF